MAEFVWARWYAEEGEAEELSVWARPDCPFYCGARLIAGVGAPPCLVSRAVHHQQ
jgi:hypothetical protein